MTHRMSTVFLVVATLGIGILQTSAATRMQQAIVVDPPSLDGPLIFDSSGPGSGGAGSNIPGPKFRVVPMRGLSLRSGLPAGSQHINHGASRPAADRA